MWKNSNVVLWNSIPLTIIFIIMYLENTQTYYKRQGTNNKVYFEISFDLRTNERANRYYPLNVISLWVFHYCADTFKILSTSFSLSSILTGVYQHKYTYTCTHADAQNEKQTNYKLISCVLHSEVNKF